MSELRSDPDTPAAESATAEGAAGLRPVDPRLVVFDLDGTLIESLPAIETAVNEVRRKNGRPPRSTEEVRSAIGDGARVLSGRLFSDFARGDDLDAIHLDFLEVYERQSVLDPHPWRRGARELLDHLLSDGLELAILTNKPLHLTERILERTGTSSLFRAVRCPENSPRKKPDPSSLLALIAEAGRRRGDTVFVGDSVVDFATGRGAGVTTFGVRGGYRAEGEHRPDRWFEDPAALDAAWREDRWSNRKERSHGP